MLAKLISELIPRPGHVSTCLNGVKVFRADDYTGKVPMVYEPCICIVAQGHKIGYVNDLSFHAMTLIIISLPPCMLHLHVKVLRLLPNHC